MKDQDENEDIFEALGIEMDEKPYFIYITFYVYLAIIKKNIYDATKDENQMRLFIKYCIYIKVSLLGVDSLWGDCTFIPADWGS